MRLYSFFWLMIFLGWYYTYTNIYIYIYICWGVSQSFKGNPHQATRRDDTGFWRIPSCDCGCVRRPTPVDWWLVGGSMMMHGGWSGWSIKYIAISMDTSDEPVLFWLLLFLMFGCLCFFGVFCLFSGIDEWWSKKLRTNSDKWIMTLCNEHVRIYYGNMLWWYLTVI